MPRSRISRGSFKAEVLTNGLIASARNLTSRPETTPKKVKQQDWQEQGWYWYDTIEVYHYGVQWVGNIISRAKLVALENGEATTNQVALDALAAFFGGPDQHGEFLRQAAIHMTVAGEGYLIGQEVDGVDHWMIAAATGLKVSAGAYKFDGEELDPNALVMRFWRPHPRKPSISDSPTRPLLPVLSQLDELTKYVSAQLDSRLSGAGILIVPQEVTFPSQVTGTAGETQQTGLNGFLQEFADTAAAAKQNRESSASRVPMGMQVPGEQVDNVKHLTFWTPLDEHAKDLRDETVRRIALGMDMPPEALLGTGDTNHWGAWQIEDSLIKSHSEPLLALITEALTEGYLRVLLEEDGMTPEEAATFSIGADTAEMRLRPNRSKEALELGDRLMLSAAAQRRENGFTEEDAPDEAEINRMLLMKIAQGSPSPEFVQAAAKSLGIDIEVPKDAETGGERPLPRSLEEHPRNDIPDTQDADAASLLASAEAALFHAFTRAGNRIKSTSVKIDGIPSEVTAADRYQFVTLSKSQLDFVLEDAWPILDRLTLPGTVDRVAFETALDNYARMLMSSRQPYDRSLLQKYLTLALKDAA